MADDKLADKNKVKKTKPPKTVEYGISQYFSWKEAIYLPKWDRLATSEELTPEIVENLTKLFVKMDVIRKFFSNQILVHCAFRPPKYNKEIGGAKKSAHMEGKAVDFHVRCVTCDDAKSAILRYNLLEKLEMRMENRPGSNWIHLDTRAPGKDGKRFFLP